MRDYDGLTSALGSFAAKAQVPGSIIESTRGQLLNGLANLMQGRRDPAFLEFEAAVRPHLPVGEVRIAGLSYRTDALSAAGLGCVAANILEFDDTHPETLIHPTAPVLGALLPLMLQHECSLIEVLAAIAIGTEVAVRIGLALGPSHYERGWHISATCGALGAAAAAARLMGQGVDRVGHAIGIASAMCSGLVINLSSPAKAIGMMRAGRNGLEAALLAGTGVQAAPDALEGKGGFLELTSLDPDPSAGLVDLSERWRGLETSVKPYPTCAVIHPVLDGLLDLRKTVGGVECGIESIEVEGPPLMLVRADRPDPVTPLEAKLSLQHTVAAAWISGTAGIAEFTADKLTDPALRALARKVVAHADPEMAPGTARVAIHLSDGRAERVEVLHPVGSPGRPMSRAQINAKCRPLLMSAGSDFPGDRVMALCWTGTERSDLVRLLDMMETDCARST